jgi:hypothetical protein
MYIVLHDGCYIQFKSKNQVYKVISFSYGKHDTVELVLYANGVQYFMHRNSRSFRIVDNPN